MARIIERGDGYLKVRGSKRTVTVTRYRKSDGDSFTGWVARCDDGANYSDPLSRVEAYRSARRMADGEYGY